MQSSGLWRTCFKSAGNDRGIGKCVFRKSPGGWTCHVMFFEEVAAKGFGKTKLIARAEARKKVLTGNLRAVCSGHGNTFAQSFRRFEHGSADVRRNDSGIERPVCGAG